MEYQQMKEEYDLLDKENLKLHEQTADLNLEVQTLREELEHLRVENQNLMQAAQNFAPNLSKSNDDRQQTTSPERLQEIREQVLASLKLGRQAPGYKAAKQALDKFIETL